MRMLFLSIFISSLTTGCSSSVTESKIWRGVYSEGFEVSSFTSCGDRTDFWLYAQHPKTMKDVEEKIIKIRTERGYMYPEVYIEFEGSNKGKANDGFAESYDSVVLVDKLLMFKTEIPYSCLH
ncbi:hypothetical protein [Aeromonas veronii]|uniref:hypothetical protein n=1 Tax=Aeromonas veronii TaxID=654 RepID=UPI00293729A7|nr:hypothetical protein [Aeromonas veronii]WOE87226.1 hypothetical protein RY930_23495 [Aeromonas veronii]